MQLLARLAAHLGDRLSAARGALGAVLVCAGVCALLGWPWALVAAGAFLVVDVVVDVAVDLLLAGDVIADPSSRDVADARSEVL